MLSVLIAASLCGSVPIYKDPSKPIKDRVDDLIDQMTLEEKVGQLMILDGRSSSLKSWIKNWHLGSTFYVLGDYAKDAYKWNKETRLQIPLLVASNVIHGHAFWPGATVFPSQLAMACSWDVERIKDMVDVSNYEAKYTGIQWAESPVACITRDLRWGRVDETFGEDPYLISLFAKTMVIAYQGSEDGINNDTDHMMACTKHFVGYGETQGGRDGSEADMSHRKLETYFLPPFEEAAKVKSGSYMVAYPGIDGVPCAANKWLLRDTLRDRWQWSGLVVTDWNNVGDLHEGQKVAKTYAEAAAIAVKAGNDMMMSTGNFYQGCLDAVKQGLLEEKYIDEACRNVLTAKFKLGLFEDQREPQTEKALARRFKPENRNKALKAAEEAAVLIKNKNHYLPLNEQSLSTIAIIGPNADHVITQNGDWSLVPGEGNPGEHPRNCTVTVLDGIRARFHGEVLYELGAGIESGEKGDLNKAMEYANKADTVIVVIGDRRCLTGESHSVATLNLQGQQLDLLYALVATGKKFIINVISGKPLIIPDDITEAAEAIIWQFSPGMLGGTAFANLIFGDVYPSGRLTVTFPQHIGQNPIYYNYIRGQHGSNYADLTEKPKYAFGYGLTYTEFEYISASLPKKVYSKNEDIKLKVTVKNVGDYDGTEVVQVYLVDLVCSVTWVAKELKGFARVDIKKGETKEVEIIIPASSCSIVNADAVRVVEPGDFELLVGKSAEDIKFKVPFTIPEDSEEI